MRICSTKPGRWVNAAAVRQAWGLSKAISIFAGISYVSVLCIFVLQLTTSRGLPAISSFLPGRRFAPSSCTSMPRASVSAMYRGGQLPWKGDLFRCAVPRPACAVQRPVPINTALDFAQVACPVPQGQAGFGKTASQARRPLQDITNSLNAPTRTTLEVKIRPKPKCIKTVSSLLACYAFTLFSI